MDRATEYEVGCRYLLERGISAVLLDAPGQGETRLFGGLHLDEHVVDAITAILDVVVADPGCDGQVGLWGNSAGGWLAALAAAADRMALDAERLRRVCCALVVVHGTPDRVLRVEGARRIHEGAGSPDKTLTPGTRPPSRSSRPSAGALRSSHRRCLAVAVS